MFLDSNAYLNFNLKNRQKSVFYARYTIPNVVDLTFFEFTKTNLDSAFIWSSNLKLINFYASEK